ncbi:MAG: Cna B-type domain-containing protein, partial [Lachnospiraceae bacterium]|nr:Cna B-type domain-containing protein [Lachnospiraceae bacterium]
MSMGDRGRSRKREARRIWKQRLSAVIAIVLVVSMVLNTPLSIRGLGFGISSVYASASNAGYSENGWATASNAEYKKGESQEVDIYVIAEDNDISAGNMAGMTLYLKNNTEEEITNGTLTFKGNHINKEDGYFTDISEGAAPDNGAEEEISGEDLLYEESRAAVLANGGQPSTGGESDDSGRAASGQTEEEENDALEEREAADFEADFGLDEEEENQHVLTGLTLAPGQLYEVYFEFYTEEDEEAAKASVSFKFKGEQADRKIRSEERFAYSIGLPYVSVNLEGGALVETGVEEEMNIWMNEPGWTTLEEEDAEEEETATRPNAGRGEYATKSGADRAEASTATKPNADRAEEEKIDKYTSEAMKIEDAKVSYKVEVFGTSFRKFKPKKAEEAADIGWISCVYEMARDAKPGVYYGKVTADGTWNRKKFITSQGFLFEVTGEGTVNLDAELNGTRVEVTGPASSFPEADKLELEVSELNEEEKTAVDLALEEGTTPYAMFTLNLLADGEATDLEGPVTVKMSNDIIAENTKTVVEEAAKEEAEEEALEAAALAAEAEAKSETETAPVAEAEAEDAPVNELSADSEPETLSESQIRKGPGMLKAAKAPAVSHLTADGSLDVEKKKEEDVEEVILADSESVGLTLLRVDTVSAQTEKTASGVTRKGALQAETDAIPAAYVLTGVGAIMPTADYDAKTTVTVTKKWVGGEDEEHKPVTIRLYRDGTAIGSSAILSGDSNWTYTFKDLDVFDEGWQKNIYTVKEDDVEGYRSSYDYKDNKFTGDAESRYTLTKADVPPFDANNQYILKTGENALSARWNDVNQNALTADANGLYTVDESMFWSVESNKDGTYYLKNNSSSYLYWKTGYDSGWSFARRSTSATKFSYDSESGVLSFKYNDRIKYLSTDNRGSISSSFDKDSALNIEFYIAELDEENGIEVTITNTKIPEGGGVDSTISYSKKIDYLGDNPGVNPDGNNDYRLYLDAAGQTQKGLDIVLVLDSSGSMDNNNRMRDLNTVLTEDGGILDSLLSNPQNKVSVVYFASQAELTQDWIDGAGAKEIVEKNLKTDGNGGTNYSAGLIKAVQQLNAVKDDGNEKCLIFMSDGKPTYYATKNKSQVSADNLDFSGNTAYGYGGDGGKYESINAAYATAFYNYCMTNNLIGADNIYTIAFGVPQGTDAENAAKVLKNMTGNKEGHYLSSENGTEALKNAFKGVLEAMGPHDISITDKLSEYVDYAGNWAVDIYVGDNKKAPTLTESDFNNRDSSAWNDYWKKVFTVNGTVPEGVGVSVDNTKKTITLTMPSSYKIPVGSRIVLS